LFGEFRNLREFWPTQGSNSPAGGTPPWPDNPLERMVWLVTSGAQPWMPISTEAEEAYVALIGKHRPGGTIGGERGFVAVQSGRGVDRMRG
jgi:hypothetical protein